MMLMFAFQAGIDAAASGKLQLFKSFHISAKIFNEWFSH